MKVILWSFIFLSTISAVQARTIIISDVDDTIKMTGVLNSKKSIVYNGIFGKKAFAGMSELYQEISTGEDSIYYVSGSPKIIKCRITEFLEVNDYPQAENTFLKENLKADTIKFKTETISRIISDEQPDKVILIGDDTQDDPEIYNIIYNSNPGLVKAIYIHAVQDRKLPANPVMKNYFSVVEIAAWEFTKERLAAGSLVKVTDAFLSQPHKSGIVLNTSYCPKKGRAEIEVLKLIINDQVVLKMLEETQAKIIKTCR